MVKKVEKRNAVLGLVAGFALAAAGSVNAAAPLPKWDGTLPAAGDPNTSQQYQDFTIYSLNYLSELSAKNPNPGDTYYIGGQDYNYKTGVGQLQDDVVIQTGNTGNTSDNTDTCGPTGCDNAYPYPSPSDNYSSTSFTYTDPIVAVPGEEPRSTWTAEQGALAAFIGDGDLTFIFNLNEDNGGDPNTLDGQAILVSARVTLTEADGTPIVSFYLGANSAIPLPCSAGQVWAGGCAPLGGLAYGEPEADPMNTLANGQAPTDGAENSAEIPGIDEYYDAMLALNPGPEGGFVSLDPRWAYVHGAISTDATTGQFLGFGTCGFTGFANCETISQNLGANEAAFAAINLALSEAIKTGVYNGMNVAFMNVDLIISGQTNGFEQLIIIATNVPDFEAPTPGTLAIMALGLLLMGMRARRLSASEAV